VCSCTASVIGRYVAPIFEESKRRPLYLLEDVVDSSDSSSASRWASSVF
jgi:hypothetical protein